MHIAPFLQYTSRHCLAAALVAAGLVGCSTDKTDAAAPESEPAVVAESVAVAEVDTVTVRPDEINHVILSNGKLHARQSAELRFDNPGTVSKVFVRNGSRVRKGDPVASLDTYTLEARMRQCREALSRASLDMQDVIIGQGYDPSGEIPAAVTALARTRSGYDAAEAALDLCRKEIEAATLRAPFDGLVANLTLRPHSATPATDPACLLINDSGMEVDFKVLEGELAMIASGNTVDVAPVSGAPAASGKVVEINPLVDAGGQVAVKAVIDGARDGFLDGMNARVTLRVGLGRGLAVPKSAVVTRNGREVVFTLGPGNRAIWNYVTTGVENNTSVVIDDGLEPGACVIVSGNATLAHESPVTLRSGL